MMAEFRKASNDFRSTIESEVEAEKIRDSLRIEPPKVEPFKADRALPAETGPASPEATAAAPDVSAHPPEAKPDTAAPAVEPVPEAVSRESTPDHT
jgi:hypothetical protein